VIVAASASIALGTLLLAVGLVTGSLAALYGATAASVAALVAIAIAGARSRGGPRS
jgi:hypothetical protein